MIETHLRKLYHRYHATSNVYLAPPHTARPRRTFPARELGTGFSECLSGTL
ncbi:hypothetical protein QBC32DRAFT_221836 [Pseudoneurospora amorphoporcata]|uniref:Uncharacterized protein n=1 Tax=Pseudoneurospora amorphoporcata TaxID=241081 RepID=A0AAN6NQS8_9PEZI|nr:hypothetical protein QBC32DRAFT_221836 [Pseudoneurospora amorphoporcata]